MRSNLIGFKVNDQEKQIVEQVTRERGHRSISDCLRAAFNLYASSKE